MKYYGSIAAEGAAMLEAMSTADLEVIENFFDKTLALQRRHTDKIRASGKKQSMRRKTKRKIS